MLVYPGVSGLASGSPTLSYSYPDCQPCLLHLAIAKPQTRSQLCRQSIIMSSFNPWRHSVPLIMATGQGLGGLMPFWNPTNAIRAFGLSDRIATAQPAHLGFMVYGSRATIIGTAMWISYLRGNLGTVDTLMALNFYGSAVDAYVCWLEGETGKAWFRGLLAVVVGGWGLLGITAGGP
jgi:hypothetical protein